MKLAITLFTLAVIVFTSIAGYLPSLLKVDEEDIEKNMTLLKKRQWFQNYLQQEMYRELFIYNKQVRNTIGKFNIKKLKKDSFPKKYQVRLEKALQANSL